MEEGIIYNDTSEIVEPAPEIKEAEKKEELKFVEDFVFENRKYIGQKDFESTFSIRQAEEAAPFINEGLTALKPFMQTDESGGLKLQFDNIIDGAMALLNTKINSQILALIFWDEGETKFNTNNFRKRIDIFRDLPLTKIKDLKENVGNFFVFILSESGTSVLTSIR